MTISTVAELVDAFGGHREVATWAGVSLQAVYGWIRDGELPRPHHLAAFLKARELGLAVDIEALFGVTDHGEYITVVEAMSA